MNQNREAPIYRPIRVEDSSSYEPLKGTVRTKKIHYVLADGTQSWVDVPHEDFNAETVEQRLREEAERHFRVMDIAAPIMQLPPQRAP